MGLMEYIGIGSILAVGGLTAYYIIDPTGFNNLMSSFNNAVPNTSAQSEQLPSSQFPPIIPITISTSTSTSTTPITTSTSTSTTPITTSTSTSTSTSVSLTQGSINEPYEPLTQDFKGSGYYKSYLQTTPVYIGSQSAFNSEYLNNPSNNGVGTSTSTSYADALVSEGIANVKVVSTSASGQTTSNIINTNASDYGSKSNPKAPFISGFTGAGYYKSYTQTTPVYISSISDFNKNYVG